MLRARNIRLHEAVSTAISTAQTDHCVAVPVELVSFRGQVWGVICQNLPIYLTRKLTIFVGVVFSDGRIGQIGR